MRGIPALVKLCHGAGGIAGIVGLEGEEAKGGIF